MENEIRLAKKQDIPDLCRIWKSCFSDSEEYIKLFYSENFDRIKVLVYTVDGKPVSILHLLDSTFVNKNDEQKAKYLYAGGTLPKYRKKGYFARLLNFAISQADKSGDALFMKPATSLLAEFFSHFSFKTDYYYRLVRIQPVDKRTVSACDISYKEYNSMRNSAFSQIPFAKWDDSHIRWCVKENSYYSGRTLKIKLGDEEYFLMGYPDNNTLIINETNLSLNTLKRLSGGLCDLFSTKNIQVYMPDGPCNEGDRIIASTIYNTPFNNTYVNQILI